MVIWLGSQDAHMKKDSTFPVLGPRRGRCQVLQETRGEGSPRFEGSGKGD